MLNISDLPAITSEEMADFNKSGLTKVKVLKIAVQQILNHKTTDITIGDIEQRLEQAGLEDFITRRHIQAVLPSAIINTGILKESGKKRVWDDARDRYFSVMVYEKGEGEVQKRKPRVYKRRKTNRDTSRSSIKSTLKECIDTYPEDKFSAPVLLPDVQGFYPDIKINDVTGLLDQLQREKYISWEFDYDTKNFPIYSKIRPQAAPQHAMDAPVIADWQAGQAMFEFIERILKEKGQMAEKHAVALKDKDAEIFQLKRLNQDLKNQLDQTKRQLDRTQEALRNKAGKFTLAESLNGRSKIPSGSFSG